MTERLSKMTRPTMWVGATGASAAIVGIMSRLAANVSPLIGNTLLVAAAIMLIMSAMEGWAKFLAAGNIMLFAEEEDVNPVLVKTRRDGERVLRRVGPANWLGFFRFAVGPAVLVVYCWQVFGEYSNMVALVLLLAGAITDPFDGAVARKRGETTPFGRMLDPMADKSIQYLPAAGLIIHLVHTGVPTQMLGTAVLNNLFIILLRDLVLLAIFLFTRVNQKPTFISKARSATFGVLGVEVALIVAGVKFEFLDMGFEANTIWLCAILSIISMVVEAIRLIRTYRGSAL